MSTVTKKTQDDDYMEGLEAWLTLNPDCTSWDTEVVAQWLVENKHFGLKKRVVVKEIARRLAKAQNRARVRNEQGKSVRVFHAAKLPAPNEHGETVQRTFWANRLTMDASFAHKSFEQRQKQAEGFCRSMSHDADDVNTNNPNLGGNKIQLELDFTYVAGKPAKKRVQTIPADTALRNEKIKKQKPR